MPELTAADVELYTKGRLLSSGSDGVETTRILNRALAAARRYCEWHVTPVKAIHVVTLDGPCGRVLMLPTLRLAPNGLTSVVEDGVTLNLADIRVSAGGPVRLRKKSRARWSSNYSSIVVTMTHGYLEADAEDWRMAVLDAVDRFSQNVGTRGLKRYIVDDVERDWFDQPEVFNERLMEPYRILAPA
jgi:hypothetical protein